MNSHEMAKKLQVSLGDRRRVDYAAAPMRLLCLSLFALLVTPSLLGAQTEKPKVKVTAVFDGPSPVFDAVAEDLAREIKTQLSDRFDVKLVALEKATGRRRASNANSKRHSRTLIYRSFSDSGTSLYELSQSARTCRSPSSYRSSPKRGSKVCPGEAMSAESETSATSPRSSISRKRQSG